ncbi:MAG: glycosyltransferase [Gemmatimonadaceae bacterium]|nr:glycosyltransferase [Gemmatimonadaceae bacterium]
MVGWIAYPQAMVHRGIRRRVARSGGDASPCARISVILATREDDTAIARRIENLLASDYPLELLDVIISLDDSVSSRSADICAMFDGRARVVSGSAPGKAAALNAGVEASTTDLLLFIDSAQYFERDTIARLVGEMHEPSWGALTATLAATSGDAFMDRYWQRELTIRQGQESQHGALSV